MFFTLMFLFGCVKNGFHPKYFYSPDAFLEVATNTETIGMMLGIIPETWLTIQFLRTYVAANAFKSLLAIMMSRREYAFLGEMDIALITLGFETITFISSAAAWIFILETLGATPHPHHLPHLSHTPPTMQP